MEEITLAEVQGRRKGSVEGEGRDDVAHTRDCLKQVVLKHCFVDKTTSPKG